LRLVLKVPPDASILSSTLYEGIAYLLSVAGGEVRPDYIELPDDAFVRAFRSVADESGGGLEKYLEIATTGKNDKNSINAILNSLGIKAQNFWPKKRRGEEASKVSYGRLIATIAELAVSRPEALARSGEINVSVWFKGKEVVIGLGKPLLTLALFKSCDRYGSLRVWEFTSISEQVGQRLSLDVALICLLGLYSSYVRRVGNSNYFLFLDPSEVAEALSTSIISGDDASKILREKMNARNAGKEVIAEFPEATVIPSAILARIALSLRLARALDERNIEVLRLRLVRVDEEGNIYKVYGDTPVEARRQPYVKGDLGRSLSEHVSGSSPLMHCVRLFARKSQSQGAARIRLCEENDHVLKAIDALYRFTALMDPAALAEYVRHLRDAADALEALLRSGGDGGAAGRMRTYRRWVAGLDRAVGELIK